MQELDLQQHQQQQLLQLASQTLSMYGGLLGPCVLQLGSCWGRQHFPGVLTQRIWERQPPYAATEVELLSSDHQAFGLERL